MQVKLILSGVHLIATAALFAVPAPGPDSLSQAELQEAFKVLRTRFIGAGSLDYDTINRSALDGLLHRLGPGAELIPTQPAKEQAPKSAPGFHAELLAGKFAYLRPSAYSLEELGRFEKEMTGFHDAKADFLILDLRVPQPKASLEAAARMLDRFVAPDTMLFRVVSPSEKSPKLFISKQAAQRWKGPVLLLMDSETCGAAELMAAIILRNYPALSLGEPTPGRTVEYQQVPLNDAVALRYAAAEVVLADDQSLFGKGIKPVYEVKQPLEAKHRVFEATVHKPLRSYVFEHSRPRLNEAALVHDTDPELDYHLARSRGETTPYDTVPLLDKVVQRAVDLAVTLRRAAQ
ncbi:MAG: hypothetical protein KGS60_00230 [Verrucomicrobia bacterium]|nr:hypothetical protein [Verrucomicrobiota bacterium]